MLRFIQMSPRIEANIFALFLTTIFILGIISLVVVLFALLWLASQSVMVMMASIVESCSIIGNLYSGSDSLTKLLIICIVGTVLYKVACKVWRK